MQEKQNLQLVVTRDGELDAEFHHESTVLERASEAILGRLGAFTTEVGLQVRMAAFDTVNGTHYRSIRNELKAEQRRHQFEHKIGLVAVHNQ